MQQLLAQHSFFAICLIVTLEEANVPLPIPGDLLLVYAGAMTAHAPGQFVLWLLALTIFPTMGSFVLYEICRHGGRPLIERYGQYIKFGPKEQAWSESLLERYGLFGIAVGRSVPIVRHAVTIACGLLDVSRRDYLIGQLVGGLVNALLFMVIGALLGPSALEMFHLPRLAVRLLEMSLLAVGLPALLWWLCTRIHGEQISATRRSMVGPALLASGAGLAAMAATWAAAAALAGLLGQPRQLNVTVDAADWLTGRGFQPGTAYVLVLGGLLLLCAALGTIYELVLRPQITTRPRALLLQTLVLAALGCVLTALLIGVGLLAPNNQPFAHWWQSGGAGLMLTLGLGACSFAATTVCGHSLGVALVHGQRPWEKA